jgi:hypothetical protein
MQTVNIGIGVTALARNPEKIKKIKNLINKLIHYHISITGII